MGGDEYRRSFLLTSGVVVLAFAVVLVMSPRSRDREVGESTSGNLSAIHSERVDPEDASQKTRVRVRDSRPTFREFLGGIAPETDLNDVSDAFFQGYLCFKHAGRLQENNRSSREISDTYAKAYAFYKAVAMKSPEWKVEMVRAQMEKTEDRLRELYLVQKTR